MTPLQVRHASTDDFGRSADLQGYIGNRDDERLPPFVAVPLVAGLSTVLWAAIWYIGRSLTGL